MTGKEKCELLRQVRKEIAESNGIVYLSSPCSYDGDCKGTCPKCDAEIRYLDSEIQRLASCGKSISLSGLTLSSFNLEHRYPVKNASVHDTPFDNCSIPTMGSLTSDLEDESDNLFDELMGMIDDTEE